MFFQISGLMKNAELKEARGLFAQYIFSVFLNAFILISYIYPHNKRSCKTIIFTLNYFVIKYRVLQSCVRYLKNSVT